MLTKPDTLKLIVTIGRNGKKLDSNIQEAAVSSVYYSVCYGDVTIGQKLVKALNAGSRKNALCAFLEHYGQFEISGKTVEYHKVAEYVDCLENEEASEAHCASIKVSWTEFKKEKITSKYDVVDTLAVAYKRLQKMMKNKEEIPHSDLALAVMSLYEEWKEANSTIVPDDDEQEEQFETSIVDQLSSMQADLRKAA